MKKALIAALVLAAGMTTRAQMRSMDFGVAGEVVRGLTSERTGLEILQSTNLLANYRDLAIQQELSVEAVRRGLTERVDVQRTLEQYRRQVLVAALRQEIERKVTPPTEEKIAAAFKEIKPPPTLPAAYQMDAWLVPAADTQSLALVKSMAVGKPVADETVATIKAPRLVSQEAEAWLAQGQISTNVWNGLAQMLANEVRLFPDGSNTMAVRRGAFRAERPLTLDEARPRIVSELTAREGEAAWRKFLEEKAKELGLAN
jgi:hypothetical protein